MLYAIAMGQIKSIIANVTILNNNYVLLEADSEEQSKLLLPNRFARFPFLYHHTALSMFKKVVIKCKLEGCNV